jgi:hypothetical protein
MHDMSTTTCGTLILTNMLTIVMYLLSSPILQCRHLSINHNHNRS